MPVISEIHLKLTQDEVLRREGFRGRGSVRPEMQKQISELLETVSSSSLLQPTAAYEMYDIVNMKADKTVLNNDASVNGTLLPSTFPEAGKLAVMICTIGTELENRVTEYSKNSETLRAMQAMDAALSELSVSINPEDAGRALYLCAAPGREMSMDIAKGLGDYLRELAENAIIRSGDFPRERSTVEVTLIFSQLAFVQKVRDYYDRASAFAHTQKDRLRETAGRLRDMEDAAKELPSLI